MALAAARDAFDDWVDQTQLPAVLSETSVEVLDRNGQLLRAYTVENGIWRLGVTADEVDPLFLDMLIAYEDKRFYAHAGVDLLAMARATLQSAWNGRVVSGGSTLTMQVSRLLENSGTGRWKGKVRQMRLAWALERRLSKDRILALYLTHAPYGGNLEGLRAATLSWYGKEPTRLTPAQAAFLIALPQSPERRRPDRHLRAAQDARDRVLTRLETSKTLTVETALAAKTETIPAEKHPFPTLAAHLSDRALADAPEKVRHNVTLEKGLQVSLERLASNTLTGKQERLSIAMLVADHQTGEILASVGSGGYSNHDHREGFVDMTQAVRSPGSTLKPLVYALGIDQGLIHPETIIDDRPVRFGSYAPQNFDGQFRGELRVADALQQSLNIPVVLLADQIGPARIMSAMQKTGAAPRLPSGKAGLAMVLGGVGVTLEELVQIYAMQARGGIAIDLTWQADVEQKTGTRVLSRAASWQVGHILSGISLPSGMSQRGLAFKTGTSYGHRDAWAVGYDGQHVIAVWIGRPDGTPVPGAFGGDLAAPVLFEAFQYLKPKLDPLGPPPPKTLMVNAAALPLPLQRFRGRNAVFETAADAPKLAFPPDGARLLATTKGLTIKVKNGELPYSVLTNGHLAATQVHHREMTLSDIGKGASTVTIVDAQGRSDRVSVWLE
ncbi:penicillin-binding protein 1C [Shimia thalassica]|nr:penicillin-binding protein 1C [Shimia thalassica]MDP2581137.1 penicillin-binding protein 1C [Shimia thalassica]